MVCDVDAWRQLAEGPAPEPLTEPEGLTVHRLRSRLGVLGSFATHQLGTPTVHRAQIEKIVRDGRFDVINFHNISLVGGPGLFSVGGKVPTKLYMAHEHWLVCPTHVLWRHRRERCTTRQCARCVLHYRRPPQLWRRNGVVTRGLEHIDEFLAISEFSRLKHAEFGFPREMTVLPYAMPDRDLDDTARNVPSQSRPFFLFVGRLEKIKGLDEVIPVMRRYPGADLLIAGKGSHERTLRGLAAGVENVRFLGWLDAPRLRAYYRDCIALIVPSVCFETFGLIVAEAFRDSTPVIARDLGPFPELVRTAGGGELFCDEESLLKAMSTLQSDPTRRAELGRSARVAWEKNWSEAAVIPQYLAIIDRIRNSTS